MKSHEHETHDARPCISRRDIVLGTAGIAALIAIGATKTASADEPSFLRPPGGQDSVRFESLCIRCDRCRSACPRNAIGIAHIEEGLAHARTPVMRYRLGYCDMCEGEFKCISACPTGALTSFDASSDCIGTAVIDASECLTYQQSARCDARCVNACAWRALSLDASGRLVIDERLCNECGACEYLCVSSVYGSYGASGRRGINIEKR